MKRILLIIISALLLLTGCGILERDYTQVTRHVDQRADSENASALRAEGYAELVSSAQYFVTLGANTGTIRLYQYGGDIEQAVQNACDALLRDDPVGAYALRDVTCRATRIVSYYECVFHYAYKRSLEEIAAIRSVSSRVGFRRQVADALRTFSDRLVLRTGGGYESADQVQRVFWEVYYDTPEAALTTPEVAVQLYPDHGAARVVEMTLDWGTERETLEEQSAQVTAAAARLMGQDSGGTLTNVWLLCTRLRSGLDWNEEGPGSVYAALVQGEANSEGIAMAYQLLCDMAGIPCRLVRGTREESVHCWNLITVDGASWHLDLTARESRDRFLHTDEELEDRGYTWSRTDYPACTGKGADQSAEREQEAESDRDGERGGETAAEEKREKVENNP